mmetsp:Transcript_52268/g.131373  ORF Transcript_52268/g.131373 Transcript_52268/m.131373 type:complete len:308 (+) Transcript_52268:344-1267(+)
MTDVSPDRGSESPTPTYRPTRRTHFLAHACRSHPHNSMCFVCLSVCLWSQQRPQDGIITLLLRHTFSKPLSHRHSRLSDVMLLLVRRLEIVMVLGRQLPLHPNLIVASQGIPCRCTLIASRHCCCCCYWGVGVVVLGLQLIVLLCEHGRGRRRWHLIESRGGVFATRSLFGAHEVLLLLVEMPLDFLVGEAGVLEGVPHLEQRTRTRPPLGRLQLGPGHEQRSVGDPLLNVPEPLLPLLATRAHLIETLVVTLVVQVLVSGVVHRSEGLPERLVQPIAQLGRAPASRKLTHRQLLLAPLLFALSLPQ